jgi:hypothetical protein
MTLFEDLVIVHSRDADKELHEYSEFRIKGFARRTIGERDAMRHLEHLLHQQRELEAAIRTVREDFPQLFEDEKEKTK